MWQSQAWRQRGGYIPHRNIHETPLTTTKDWEFQGLVRESLRRSTIEILSESACFRCLGACRGSGQLVLPIWERDPDGARSVATAFDKWDGPFRTKPSGSSGSVSNCGCCGQHRFEECVIRWADAHICLGTPPVAHMCCCTTEDARSTVAAGDSPDWGWAAPCMRYLADSSGWRWPGSWSHHVLFLSHTFVYHSEPASCLTGRWTPPPLHGSGLHVVEEPQFNDGFVREELPSTLSSSRWIPLRDPGVDPISRSFPRSHVSRCSHCLGTRIVPSCICVCCAESRGGRTSVTLFYSSDLRQFSDSPPFATCEERTTSVIRGTLSDVGTLSSW